MELLRKRRQEIDAIVLDMVMPGLDGVETLRRFRDLQPDVRVVLTSGFDEDHTDAHAAAFLRKPYEAEDLVDAVRTALN